MGSCVTDEGHGLRWTICTRCYILADDLLYVASILGRANGLHRFVSAFPAGISICFCSPMALRRVGLFLWKFRMRQAILIAAKGPIKKEEIYYEENQFFRKGYRL